MKCPACGWDGRNVDWVNVDEPEYEFSDRGCRICGKASTECLDCGLISRVERGDLCIACSAT